MASMKHDPTTRTVTIQYDQDGPMSKSGKSKLLFSTAGFKFEGDVGVSVNVIRK